MLGGGEKGKIADPAIPNTVARWNYTARFKSQFRVTPISSSVTLDGLLSVFLSSAYLSVKWGKTYL